MNDTAKDSLTDEGIEEPRALVTGDKVAWVTRQAGRTCGLSAVHRVYDGVQTYCLREIPEEKHRLPYPPLPSLHVCKRCETLCARAEKFLHRASA